MPNGENFSNISGKILKGCVVEMNIKELVKKMTLAEKASLCTGADFWHLNGVPRLGIPSIMVTDGPHGLRKQMDESDHMGINASEVAICFPTAAALASSFDRKLLKELGGILGRECQAEGVGILLGPGANIKRSPLCGRNFEYLSEDPYLSSELAGSYISGLQAEGIASSVKHFAANNQETDRMTGNSILDERTMHEIYLASFEGPVKDAKVKTVMCAYNQVNGTYMAENEELLTNILRDKWGFEGFVVSDWGAAKNQINGLKAGMELKMPGGNPQDMISIIEAVKEGILTEEELDAAVSRILSVIDFITSNKQDGTLFNREEDHEKARKIAAECAVLLKNENAALPLNGKEKVAFIGEFADKPRFQGSGSSFINSYKVVSALEEVKGKNNIHYAQGYHSKDDSIDDGLMRKAKELAENCEVAVIFAGLPNHFESEGYDRKHIELPFNQNQLIKEIASVQKNTIVVLHNGSSITMPWIDDVSAVLEMYLGGEAVGQATVDLLFGIENPSGKLAETFPIRLEDNPSYLNFPGYDNETEYREGIYVGYRYYDTKRMPVLFPFGHGLSYSSFKYSDLIVDKESFYDDEAVKVSITVTNTGSIKGKEVVQLYVKPEGIEVPRPYHELKQFEKVELAPGESKAVTFTLNKRSFAYYHTKLKDWYVESGNYVIELGSSSRDIRLMKEIEMVTTTNVPMTFNLYSSIGNVLKSTKGQEILGPVIEALQSRSKSKEKDSTDALGEGSQALKEAAMMQMPLQSLSEFGVLQKDKIEQIIYALNK